jgi:hypothetical protein
MPEALAEQGKIGPGVAIRCQGLLIFLQESFHMFTLDEFLQLFAVR